ncbi:MAG: tryptophan synthase subunit beta [Bifidobacteriaceae bacterium]|jgi:tryptophan synthase beta chain|nr:tryptophan synthase subunit beta [Bifidobacteriaceae bacterium]
MFYSSNNSEKFGGRFVPEALIPALTELEDTFNSLKDTKEFQDEFTDLCTNYLGRPTPLTHAKNFSDALEKLTGVKYDVWLKREDLLHTGAHKINNAIGQALLVKKMGKKRIIAETGAGQHGVATATVAAYFGLECTIYMGEVDAARQALNVKRMKMLGAEVREVTSGDRILKDAVNEALRDWVTNVEDTHYLLGTVCGPHPFPTIVEYFQSIIGQEAKKQFAVATSKDAIQSANIANRNAADMIPDALVACVGGGSNCIGLFNEFLNLEPKMFAFEAGGNGIESGLHAARFETGNIGYFQGSRSYVLTDENGQTKETHSISAGLDYASVGPHHAELFDSKRVTYDYATDSDVMEALSLLTSSEGIIPALESSHAVAGLIKIARATAESVESVESVESNCATTTAKSGDSTKSTAKNTKLFLTPGSSVIINISGRGDKDMETIVKYFDL